MEKPSRDADAAFMRQALALAQKGRGRVSPNPLVGCVIVRKGRVLATGYHHAVGLAHAEVDALAKLGGKAKGATVYVNLEPCNHQGRTGPCSLALIAAGVARVVCGMRDPNPLAHGGAPRLRKAGIAVDLGVLERESRELNRAFVTWVQKRRPFVTLKAASSLDGRIATAQGDSRWISSEESREMVHRYRAEVDAILVGRGTIVADNPRLTARPKGNPSGRSPRRIILDGKLLTPPSAHAVRDAWIICAKGAPTARRKRLEAAGAEVIPIAGSGGKVSLSILLRELGRRQITSLLVEGGAEVLGHFLSARAFDRLWLFVAPKILGSSALPFARLEGPRTVAEALSFAGLTAQQMGPDAFLSLDL